MGIDYTKNKQALETRLRELLGKPPELAELYVEREPDEMDQIQRHSDRHIAMETATRESRVIKSVRAALQRVADGTYGICLRCDEQIGARRLAVVPEAPYCILCQERSDRLAKAS